AERMFLLPEMQRSGALVICTGGLPIPLIEVEIAAKIQASKHRYGIPYLLAQFDRPVVIGAALRKRALDRARIKGEVFQDPTEIPGISHPLSQRKQLRRRLDDLLKSPCGE